MSEEKTPKIKVIRLKVDKVDVFDGDNLLEVIKDQKINFNNVLLDVDKNIIIVLPKEFNVKDLLNASATITKLKRVSARTRSICFRILHTLEELRDLAKDLQEEFTSRTSF